MKQFIFMYPIPEYINWEVKNGAYGWKCHSWENRWYPLIDDTKSETEKEEIRERALKEKSLRFSRVYSRILNKCIGKRYRENDFQINWLIFNEHEISNLIDVQDSDKIIECGIDFQTHATKQDDGTYIYPDNNLILDNIGDYSHLRIAGFHRWDCVDKLARIAWGRNCKVLVDEDLTEMFYGKFRDKDFRVDKYPTYNPFVYDIPEDNHFSEIFFEARKERPWLWQDYSFAKS